jgi:hypothetical protein
MLFSGLFEYQMPSFTTLLAQQPLLHFQWHYSCCMNTEMCFKRKLLSWTIGWDCNSQFLANGTSANRIISFCKGIPWQKNCEDRTWSDWELDINLFPSRSPTQFRNKSLYFTDICFHCSIAGTGTLISPNFFYIAW